MADTLVDTNVLIDALSQHSVWTRWSTEAMTTARSTGALVINPVIYAEFIQPFASKDAVDAALPTTLFRRDDLPWEAAFLAGQAFKSYRRRGGVRPSPLPDFYIGAHAQVAGLTLLTRDSRRFRTYFPDVDIVAPN